ncbi:MAG: tRNA lysidine(34) synthetase TilS [Bacteroides sp.]|nr:tRNA lysidine(34) synthetase TilS [Bacteroides sp.]
MKNELIDLSVRPIIIGLSGGADSTALLLSLHLLGYELIAAHCNFHLRGSESDRDQSHSQFFAESLGVKFEHIDFNVDAYCRQHAGTAMEEACRNLRYEWFDRLVEKYCAQCVAVGHNADDVVETFLFNLQRGTGLSGLHGILPKNDRGIVRPLLCLSRMEIEKFLTDRHVDYIVDSSNLKCDFDRNKLRNRVIPVFSAEFPKLKQGVGRTVTNVQSAERLLKSLVAEKREMYTDSEGRICIAELVQKEKKGPDLVYYMLKDAGISRQQAEDIVRNSQGSGLKFRIGHRDWIIDRGSLYPTDISDCQVYLVEDILTYNRRPIESFRPLRDPKIAYFDRSVLDGEPLRIRYWQAGDSMQPYGMKGRKKLSDIFNDSKIPVDKKDKIPLLVKGDTILWIIGLRASEQFKVTEETTEYVELTMKF